ncbi:MAG TPA: isoprenylcysteine carboxylmethyltransferase family protein [Gemmatimonadaceae bacterium]|nr:isoprenylcysteine carboxylmethyltransferase family protein [Gemmatimonadaceae bacterium]
MTYSELAKTVRLPLGFTFGIAYLLWARPTALTLAAGGAIALAGVLVRAWASGHIVKNRVLAVTGPYAHTRNPLYFGSFLIGAGFAIAAHWALLLVVIAFWLLVYTPTMERERRNIQERFPESYDVYSANVPAFVPRVIPWTGGDGEQGGFSPSLYMRHGEWKAGITYLLVMAWLAFRVIRGL